MHCTETYDDRHLSQSLAEYESFTSDLGTEVKIPQYHVDRRRMHLFMPSWLSEKTSHAPLQTEAMEDEAPASAKVELLQCQSESFLPNALPIGGAGHMIHNISKSIPATLSEWPSFHADLKIVEMVLTNHGRRERVVSTCMLGTVFERHQTMILAFSGSLYESRWGEVVSFCSMILRPLSVLRQCWSQRSYEANDGAGLVERIWAGESGPRFKPADLSRVLKEPYFRHYTLMILKLHGVPTRLHKWFDGCPCHETLLIGKGASKRERSLRQDGLPTGTCMCSSCRCWELIDGKLELVLKELAEEAESELISAIELKSADGITAPLSATALASILENFSSGIAALQVGFTVRLSWTNKMPWMLMGMAHIRNDRALHWAKKCVQLFDESPAGQTTHHPKTLLYLKPGGLLRLSVNQFILTSVMPDILKLHVANFRFIPVGDRQIEREHKPISELTRTKHAITRGHVFSVRRLKIIEARFKADVDFKRALVKRFLAFRSLKELVKVIGLEKHPMFSEIYKMEKSTWGKQASQLLWSMAERLIYRQDLSAKYQKLTASKAWFQQAQPSKNKKQVMITNNFANRN